MNAVSASHLSGARALRTEVLHGLIIIRIYMVGFMPMFFTPSTRPSWAQPSLWPPKVSGLLLLALAAGTLYLARDLPVTQRGTVGPGAFPWLLSGGLSVCSVVLLFKKSAETDPMLRPSGAWSLLAGMLLFPLLVPHLGTLSASAICGTVLARITSGSWRRALWIGPGLASLLHAVVVWGLGTPMPWWLP